MVLVWYQCDICGISAWYLRGTCVVFGGVPVWYWSCKGVVLVMYRCGTGDVPVWYWWCTGVVLAVYRCGTGGAPV